MTSLQKEFQNNQFVRPKKYQRKKYNFYLYFQIKQSM